MTKCKHAWVRWEKVTYWVGHGVREIKDDTAYVDYDDEHDSDFVDLLAEEYLCRHCDTKLDDPPSNWQDG
jgi:hypothetical protein